MLLKRQFLKFAYVDVILMVSKMFRGHLTAGVLAIGVTVVLISEIDTLVPEYVNFKHAVLEKNPYVMLQLADYQGDEIQKAIWKVL